MKKQVNIALLLGSTVFALSGCDSLRNTFGLDHYQADEFNVAENPPLSMPPNYNLIPPNNKTSVDGTDQLKNDDENATQNAKEVLLGKSSKSKNSTSSDAKAVVAKASEVQPADPMIRDTVNKEKDALSSDPNSLPEKLSKMGKQIVENAKNTSNDDNEKKMLSDSQTAAAG